VKLNTFWSFDCNFVTSGIKFIICYVLSELYCYHWPLGDTVGMPDIVNTLQWICFIWRLISEIQVVTMSTQKIMLSWFRFDHELYCYHWALGDNIAFLNMCYLNCTIVISDNLGNPKTKPEILGT
jgi:hypothetical protein